MFLFQVVGDGSTRLFGLLTQDFCSVFARGLYQELRSQDYIITALMLLTRCLFGSARSGYLWGGRRAPQHWALTSLPLVARCEVFTAVKVSIQPTPYTVQRPRKLRI